MANILTIITLITQLLPVILQTVRAVESLFPQGGQGATKLHMVAAIVQQAVDVTGEVNTTAQQLAPVLTPIIGGMVTLLNASGEFKRA